MLNPEIFREYDIRGVAEHDFTDDVVETIARAFAQYLKPKGRRTVTLGYDMRLSSPRIRDTFIRGLIGSGIDVTDIGLCPTPALYFSLFHMKPDAGVMITASHNPSEFNGFKLCVGTASIYGEEIRRIGKIAEDIEKKGQASIATGQGGLSRHPILPDYINFLKDGFPHNPDVPLKVVLDAGNATAGLAAPEAIRSMGCDVIELFSEPDGTFPNHHPDPTVPRNLETLIKTVKKTNADAGIAFDGDSDRLGVVDELGNILWGDQLMVIFSREILKERPGATFISEVKCSQTMYDDIRAHGGNAIMWKTGHSLIKARMKETGAVLAGEMSGHMFFADRYFGYDDAIYAACRLVEILKKRKAENPHATLRQMISDLPITFNTPEIRVDCPDNIKFTVVEKVKDIFQNSSGLPFKPDEVITIDGVRAVFNEGWGLIRASNTQPVLVMRFEARDRAFLEAIKSMTEKAVQEVLGGLMNTA